MTQTNLDLHQSTYAETFPTGGSDIVRGVLSRLHKVKSAGHNKWRACCPAHDDHNPSLDIGIGQDGKVLLDCKAGCSSGRVVTAMGLTFADLFPKKFSKKSNPTAQRGKIVAEYDYVDEQGHLLSQAVRYEDKEFRQRRPDPANPGRWIYKLDGVRRVLYRLPQLAPAIARGETIFVCEGEKDCNNLHALELTATCNAGGACDNQVGKSKESAKWLPAYSETLRGAHVVILPDNDPSGQTHAQTVARALLGVAASVRVLNLPGLGNKGDVSDWLRSGGCADDLLALVALQEPIVPLNEAMQCTLAGLRVAGRPPERSEGRTLRDEPIEIGADGMPVLASDTDTHTLARILHKVVYGLRSANLVQNLVLGRLYNLAGSVRGAKKAWVETAFSGDTHLYGFLRHCGQVARVWGDLFDIHRHAERVTWSQLREASARAISPAERVKMLAGRFPSVQQLKQIKQARKAAANGGVLPQTPPQKFRSLYEWAVEHLGEEEARALTAPLLVELAGLLVERLPDARPGVTGKGHCLQELEPPQEAHCPQEARCGQEMPCLQEPQAAPPRDPASDALRSLDLPRPSALSPAPARSPLPDHRPVCASLPFAGEPAPVGSVPAAPCAAAQDGANTGLCGDGATEGALCGDALCAHNIKTYSNTTSLESVSTQRGQEKEEASPHKRPSAPLSCGCADIGTDEALCGDIGTQRAQHGGDPAAAAAKTQEEQKRGRTQAAHYTHGRLSPFSPFLAFPTLCADMDTQREWYADMDTQYLPGDRDSALFAEDMILCASMEQRDAPTADEPPARQP